MGLIISIPLLYALTRLNENNTSAITCAGIYAVIKLILGFMFGTLISGASLLHLIIGSIISFLLAWLYFWLLERFTGFVWWIIFIIGAFVLFI